MELSGSRATANFLGRLSCVGSDRLAARRASAQPRYIDSPRRAELDVPIHHTPHAPSITLRTPSAWLWPHSAVKMLEALDILSPSRPVFLDYCIDLLAFLSLMCLSSWGSCFLLLVLWPPPDLFRWPQYGRHSRFVIVGNRVSFVV